MTKLKVDFNNLARGGQVRVPLRVVEDDLAVGDLVDVYDPDAELECQAVVTDIDHEAGRLYVTPIWEDDVPTSQVTVPVAQIAYVWDGARLTPETALVGNRAGGRTVWNRTAAPIASAGQSLAPAV